MLLSLKALLVVGVLASIHCQEAGAPEDSQDIDPPEDDGAPDDAPDDGAPDEDQDTEETSLSDDQLRGIHAKFDTDGDGKASLQEIMGFSESVGKAIAGKDIDAILGEMDTDKDGVLSLEEHLNDIHKTDEIHDIHNEMEDIEHRKGVESAKFKAADLNGDGRLDQKELPGLFYPETHEGVLSITVGETMRQKDTNKDSKLSPSEFWVQMDGDDSDLSKEENADFARLDTNGDGSIDAQELRAWESGRFDTEGMEGTMKKLIDVADKNGDMHITGEELVEAREQIAASDAQYHLSRWVDHHEL